MGILCASLSLKISAPPGRGLCSSTPPSAASTPQAPLLTPRSRTWRIHSAEKRENPRNSLVSWNQGPKLGLNRGKKKRHKTAQPKLTGKDRACPVRDRLGQAVRVPPGRAGAGAVLTGPGWTLVCTSHLKGEKGAWPLGRSIPWEALTLRWGAVWGQGKSPMSRMNWSGDALVRGSEVYWVNLEIRIK